MPIFEAESSGLCAIGALLLEERAPFSQMLLPSATAKKRGHASEGYENGL
jgi:hypothetical protein